VERLGRLSPDDLMIVLKLPAGSGTIQTIQAAVRAGARAVFLQPEDVFNGSRAPPGSIAGQVYSSLMEPVVGDWKPELRSVTWWGKPGSFGYGRTALALEHPFLEGLPRGVAFDAQPLYQRVVPRYTWVLDGQPSGLRLSRAVVQSTVHVDMPYTSDLFSFACGKGDVVLNTLRLAEHLDSDPDADRILENILLSVTRNRRGR